jgi:hypothetical protein
MGTGGLAVVGCVLRLVSAETSPVGGDAVDLACADVARWKSRATAPSDPTCTRIPVVVEMDVFCRRSPANMPRRFQDPASAVAHTHTVRIASLRGGDPAPLPVYQDCFSWPGADRPAAPPGPRPAPGDDRNLAGVDRGEVSLCAAGRDRRRGMVRPERAAQSFITDVTFCCSSQMRCRSEPSATRGGRG